MSVIILSYLLLEIGDFKVQDETKTLSWSQISPCDRAKLIKRTTNWHKLTQNFCCA